VRLEEGFIGEAGARTWYRVVGDRSSGMTPLVMIHGGPGAPWPDDLDAVNRLAATRPVVLYHQLGCGRSDNPADAARWTVNACVTEIGALR
jgi:proline iminopeptidase